MVADFAESTKWLRCLDVDYLKTRFGRYNQFVRELETSTKVFRFVSHNSYDAAIEASDLIIIHRGLSKMDDPMLLSKL